MRFPRHAAVQAPVLHQGIAAAVALLVATLIACAPAHTPVSKADATMSALGLPDVRLFLIGDAGGDGGDGERNAVLKAMQDAIVPDSLHSLVVFLGDNVYPSGLPDSAAESRAEAESRLLAQMNAVRRGGARALFIAGNHDWGDGSEPAPTVLAREAAFIAAHGDGRMRMLPAAGCPGPEVIDVGEALRLVLLDTEWLLRGSDDGRAMLGCVADERALFDSLSNAISSAGQRRVVVAAHHPLRSSGPHGGDFGWQQHLFPLRERWSAAWVPLPVVGSLYPILKSLAPRIQDLRSAPYARLRMQLDSVLRVHRPMVYAAGHEHNLQVLQPPSLPLLLVSGAGSTDRGSFAHSLSDTRFAERAHGFMRLDLWSDRRAQLTVFAVDSRGTATVRYQLEIE